VSILYVDKVVNVVVARSRGSSVGWWVVERFVVIAAF
jgi:hypothetical protein